MHNTFQVLILCLYLVFLQVPCTSGIPLKANRVEFHQSIEIKLNFVFKVIRRQPFSIIYNLHINM